MDSLDIVYCLLFVYSTQYYNHTCENSSEVRSRDMNNNIIMVVIQFVIDSVTICKVDAGFAPGKREEIRGTTILMKYVQGTV